MDPLKQHSWGKFEQVDLFCGPFIVLSGPSRIIAFAVKGQASGPCTEVSGPSKSVFGERSSGPYIVLSGPFITAFEGKG